MSVFRFDVISGVSYSAGGRDFLFLSGIYRIAVLRICSCPFSIRSWNQVFAMATINRLAIFFLLLKSLVSSEALFAEEIRQSLNPRDAIYGGWALSSPSCPAGTTSCKSDDNAPSCCPNEYECQYDGSTYQHFCCTTGKFPALLFSEPLLLTCD